MKITRSNVSDMGRNAAVSPADTHDADVAVLTRFNLPSRGEEGIVRAQDNWLRNRWGLFQKYCVPSVRFQSLQDFVWVIYFDPASPEWLREGIGPLADEGLFRPFFRESVSSEELRGDIAAALGRAPRTHLITANLDNDDGLARDFLQRLVAVGSAQPKLAIYLANGLIETSGRVYLQHDAHNAFAAVRDSWQSGTTCWTAWHTHLKASMAATVVDGPPAWLQVVHGQNVSNRVRGRRVSPQPYVDLFPGLLDGTEEPRRRDLTRDLLIERPARLSRELVRGSVKKVGLGVLGQDGWDRAKRLRRSVTSGAKSRRSQP